MQSPTTTQGPTWTHQLEEHASMSDSEEPLENGIYPLPHTPVDPVGLGPEDALLLDPASRRSGSSEFMEHATRLSPGISSSKDRSKLTFLNGLALVLGLQIGSGIFSVPSQVSQHVPSPLVGVLVWLLGGCVVYTGAASFIELGLAIPRNGGIQEYLQACYGDLMAFLSTWVWVFISKPSAIAMIAMIFADHMCRAAQAPSTSEIFKKALALIGIGLITLVNCLGKKSGATVANVFLGLKLFAILSISIIALGVITTNTVDELPEGKPGWFVEHIDYPAQSIWADAGDFVTAIYGALFCYGGWETIGFVTGDMSSPKRDLPRVINVSMVTAIVGFFLANLAFYACVPMETIRRQSTVAVEFGITVFGPWGGFFYSLLVSIAAMGALNANVFATGRLVVAASHRNYLPRILANQHFAAGSREVAYYQTTLAYLPARIVAMVIKFAELTSSLRLEKEVPIYALTVNGMLASMYVMVGTFNGLVTFIGISEYLFYFFAVSGIFILRSKTSLKEQGYRAWTFNPIIFCIASGFLVIRGVFTDPLQGIALFALSFCGCLAYRHRLSKQ